MEAPDPGREMGWHLKLLSKDEAGKQLVLEKYKPFRLTALRLDPGSFSSTLAREEAFDDEVWTSRLMDPLNHLVVAIDDTNQEVVCAAFLRELPAVETRDSQTSDDSSLVVFGIFGVWTLPRVRRRGIALAVLEGTKGLATDIARARGRDCRLEVDAYEDNDDAIRLYSKAGFVASAGSAAGFAKLSLLLSSH